MFKKADKKNNKNKGFSLIELMVSVGLFSVVMTISMTAIMNIMDTTRKAQSLKSIMNNLNFAVEDMTRSIKTGYDYTCSLPYNDSISFKNTEGTPIEYSSSLTGQMMVKVGNETAVSITAPEIVLDKLNFYCDTSAQPIVLIIIKGHTGSEKTKSVFNLQTTVSQRLPM